MITNSTIARLAVLAGLACACLSAGCSRSVAPGEFSGNVVDETVTLATPDLGTPLRVMEVPAPVGDQVRAGDVLVRFDTAVLDAQVDAAKAQLAEAKARTRIIDGRLDDVAEGRSELASRRRQLVTTIGELEAQRDRLAAQLRDAEKALARVKAALSAAPSVPPSVTPPPGVMPDVQALEQGVARLRAGLAKLDAGLAKARSGLRRLDSARATLGDARDRLTEVRDLAGIGVDASSAVVDIAKARADLATVSSPVDGHVVEAPRVGEVAIPEAPLVSVRPVATPRVQVWLTPEQLKELDTHGPAAVRIDSLPGEEFDARVTHVGSSAEFPPTSLATNVIHLMRAVRVEVTLESSANLPAGTPADVTVSTR